jgi:hypothetical protein
MTGGLVASGEGTWSKLFWPKPRELLRLGVNGGGLPADPDAAAAAGVGVAGGCAPELNSAQRGHLRFVSASEKKIEVEVEVVCVCVCQRFAEKTRAIGGAATYSYDPSVRSGRSVSEG